MPGECDGRLAPSGGVAFLQTSLNIRMCHSCPPLYVFSPSLQRDKRLQLTWLCEEQLFRQEMEDTDDIRLSVRLFSKCLGDKKKFCGDSLPGNSQVWGWF